MVWIFFSTNKQQSQQEGTHGDDKQKSRKIMRLDEEMVAHGEKCDSWGLKMSEIYLPIGQKKKTLTMRPLVFYQFSGVRRCISTCCKLRKDLWSKTGECRFCHLYKCINDVFAWAVCKRSCGCHSFTVLNGKGWYFSSQAPTHPVSKDRHQAHFLSLSLS